MTKIDELKNLKSKAELVSWLTKNFSVTQLRNCLKSFETESVSPLQVSGDTQIGATTSGKPVYASQTVGEACDLIGNDESGVKECVKALTGNASSWKVEEGNGNYGPYLMLTSPRGNVYYTYDEETFVKSDGKEVKGKKTVNSLKTAVKTFLDNMNQITEQELDLLFGKVQRFGARRNKYVTTAKKTPAGYKFLTYEFKNGKWHPNASWKSAKSLMSGKPFSGKTTKTGLTNFFGLKDLVVDTKFGSSFGGKNAEIYPLERVHPLSFGYSQKAMKYDRTYGQLFPLGKYAYVDGLHKGVSATFSEAVSKKRGLYPPPSTKIPNKWTYNQMQFGMAPVNYNYTGPMDQGMFDSKDKLQLEATAYSFGKKQKTVKRKATKKPVKKTLKRKATKKTVKRKATKKTVKRKATKKPVKKTTKKVVPKTLKTQAKKHGIKLTVKRGDKRVAKTEKVLKKQIQNRLKAKKTKSSVKKPVKKKSQKSNKTKKPVKKKSQKSNKTKKPVKKKSQKSNLNKFGMKKRSSHCFGKRINPPPNEYGLVKSSYASDFPGIPNSMYGYRGTQPVFGGNTGVAGYSGLGNETLHLLPKTVTGNLFKK
jgi:hypothetical protein